VSPQPITVAAVTARGSVRQTNQDTVLVLDWISQADEPRLLRMHASVAPPAVLAVADGLGGHRAGELASRLAVQEIARRGAGWAGEPAVRDGLSAVDQVLAAVAANDPETAGMATTIAGIALTPAGMVAFNVGDSRVYQIVEGYPEQLSVDDAVTVPDGVPTGRITQALGDGGSAPPHPHTRPVPVVGDLARILICSDGLSGVLTVDQLRKLCRQPDLDELVRGLLAAVYDAGAPDNVSIIAADLQHQLRPDEPATSPGAS
jgi:PPM family protein phosphatase